MTEADPNREHRQLAVIGTEGNASIFTGKECKDWAGGKTGVNYAVQGNLLTGAEVIQAMSTGFEEANGTLAERMIAFPPCRAVFNLATNGASNQLPYCS